MTNGKQITAISTQSFHATLTGLVVEGKPTVEEWMTFGEGLNKLDKAMQWVIGDWLVYGEDTYGEVPYEEALRRWPEYTRKTIIEYRSVAARIEASARAEDLSWAHHRLIAGMRPAAQQIWIERAKSKGWGYRDLDAAIHHKVATVQVIAGKVKFQWIRDARTLAAEEGVRTIKSLVRAIASDEEDRGGGVAVLKDLRRNLLLVIKHINSALGEV